MNALVFKGKVIQLAEVSFPVHESMTWEPIPEDVSVATGDSWDGENFTPPPPTAAPSPQEIVDGINVEVNDYIYARYDSGTQASFVALYVGPDATAEIKAAIESVWAWTKTVLTHYYVAKANILAGNAYEFDLSQFDATDPQVSLAALLGG